MRVIYTVKVGDGPTVTKVSPPQGVIYRLAEGAGTVKAVVH